MNIQKTLALFAIAATIACSDSPLEPRVPVNPDIRGVVVGAAAASLDPLGHFVYPNAIAVRADGIPLVDAARAGALAAAFVQKYGPSFVPYWERDRGGSIDLAALQRSSRVIPVETPFDAVPDIGCHPSIVRLFGPFYLVTMDRQAEQEVVLAVSAQTTEFSVDTGGDLVEPNRTGSDFFALGIPVDQRAPIWLTPEQAVATVALATGARITAVPQAVLHDGFNPAGPLWRIELDRPVTQLRSDGTALTTSTTYIRGDRQFYLPKQIQRSELPGTCVKIDSKLVYTGDTTVAVPVHSGLPVDFEPVTIQRP